MADSNSRSARRQSAKKQKKNQKKKFGSLVRRIALFTIIIGIIGLFVGGIVAFSFIKDAPSLDATLLKDPISSKIYDMDDQLIADLGQEKRIVVEYNEIPQLVLDAVIATEDSRFFEHMGIDPFRIGGAVKANLTEGFGSQGASTITQQVVKLSFLSPEKTIKRKVQEAWLAVQLDYRFSKEQILQMYLNKIYYENGAYGIAKAADTYFGKELSELELHEAALLAGIPQRPATYNPFKNPDLAEQRRNIVLRLMVLHDKITQAEADQAKTIPVTESLVTTHRDPSPYEAFLDRVIDEIMTTHENVDIYSDGLKIYTTIDPKAQNHVESLLNNDELYPDKNFEAGITLLDTNSGAIRALGGGRNYVLQNWNYAVDTNRPPGSTIKPIIDYAPAIEYLNWSTYHQIKDEKYQYSDGKKTIGNWDNKYMGQISLRTALQWSRNVPAVKTIQEVGLDRARQFVQNLGLPVGEYIVESDAIGGGTIELSSLQLAGAYSSLGNQGVYHKPYAIRKIVFLDGRSLDMTPKPQIVMAESTAFMVTDMLRTVVNAGTATNVRIPGIDLAGKTGTTNFDEETIKKYNLPNGAVPDIWFAGYSPSYTTAIWTGYRITNENNYIIGGQTRIASDLFRRVMEKVHEGKQTGSFTKPANVVRVQVEKGTNPPRLPSEFTPKDQIVSEYFISGTEPTKVSETFNKVEQPMDVQVQYDETVNTLKLGWSYPHEVSEDTEPKVEFKINISVDESPFIDFKTTTEQQIIVDNPIRGAYYRFEIVTISRVNPENRSDPVIIEITIPEEEDKIDLLPGIGEDEEDNQGGEGDSLLPNPIDGLTPDEEEEENTDTP